MSIKVTTKKHHSVKDSSSQLDHQQTLRPTQPSIHGGMDNSLYLVWTSESLVWFDCSE